MTYNIYSLYYKIAAERKKDEPFYRSFITLLETFNLSILILEKLLMCSCYVNCILWQHTRLINRKFLTRNIEKHQVKHDSFFFCSFPFTSIIQPLEKCHSICKPNNLPTHCSAKNWSNVNTMSFFANSLSTVATKMVSRVDRSVLNGLVFINFLKVSRIRREKEGKIENSGDTVSYNTIDRYNRHDSIDTTNVTLSDRVSLVHYDSLAGLQLGN